MRSTSRGVGFGTITYLFPIRRRTSGQRRRVRWWHATARRAGLSPAAVRKAAREPLRLLAFTRQEIAPRHRDDTMKEKKR